MLFLTAVIMNTTLPDFLRQLAANNNRPWFADHKGLYEELRGRWIGDIDRLLAYASEWDASLGRLSGKECVYRIYRDTRFSPDKSPYKTYFSAGMSCRGRSNAAAGYYLQADIRPGQSGVYGGLWCPDSAMLRKIRHAIVDNIEEFEAILADSELSRLYPGWCGNSLKTIPKGWAKDHPQAGLLRLLDYGKVHAVDIDFFCDSAWPERCADIMRPLKPLVDFINYSLYEE